ncbi:MAG TPA: SDR family NAD(P)-dependent oxidoreductase, partial [Planctomycetaceae bacterium]|nr:SDR family NAD(P)-dependent oxidoreductase [Planctomycetaceae bacterium]
MILNQFQLDGRVAVVTGGRRGLGQSMAWGLAEAGADIVCVSKHGQADETRRLVEAAGRRFFDMQSDLAEPAQRVGLIDKAIALAGHVDILVNNAGDGRRHPPEVFPEEAWRQQLELHLNATFDLSQQVARHMMKRGRGKIINVGSIMSFEAGLNIPAYAAAKHAVAGLTKSLAVSWSSHGINVN